jgi:hypothetical protein
MSRDFKWSDLFGWGNATGDPDPIWGTLSGENAIKDATKAQQAALEKALGAITGAADKGIALQAPYLKNAGRDYEQQRGLVQSGFFQQPYGKSFQSQQYSPQGFTFNPNQGQASFAPWRAQGGPAGFQAQALPNMPQMPAPQQQQQIQPRQNPVPQQGGPMQTTPDPAQVMQMVMRSMPQAQMTTNTPGQSPQNTGLMGYNPQLGTNSPLIGMGVKPPDPRLPSLQTRQSLLAMYPWLAGKSGPLEGGMPGGGRF